MKKSKLIAKLQGIEGDPEISIDSIELNNKINNSYFQRNAKVTISSDPEGKHPRRIGVVKRIGNGAWRLAGCSEWYDFRGNRVAFDGERFAEYTTITCFAHPYEDGDEARIAAENKRLQHINFLLESIKSNSQEALFSQSKIRSMADDESFTINEIEKLKKKLDFERAFLERTQEKMRQESEFHSAIQRKISVLKEELKEFEKGTDT